MNHTTPPTTAPTTPSTTTISEHFSSMTDPRTEGKTTDHKLIDIITITVCAVICRADQWTDIASYGKAKYKWLKSFLELPNGIPSHDTFGRVFGTLQKRKKVVNSLKTSLLQLTL